MIKNKKILFAMLCIIDLELHSIASVEYINSRVELNVNKIHQEADKQAIQKNRQRVEESGKNFVSRLISGKVSVHEAWTGEYDTDKYQTSKKKIVDDELNRLKNELSPSLHFDLEKASEQQEKARQDAGKNSRRSTQELQEWAEQVQLPETFKDRRDDIIAIDHLAAKLNITDKEMQKISLEAVASFNKIHKELREKDAGALSPLEDWKRTKAFTISDLENAMRNFAKLKKTQIRF